MLIEFGSTLGNGYDVVSSLNEDTGAWTTQVFNFNKEPVCDPVISHSEVDARFVTNEIVSGFQNLCISGYVKHNSKLE